MSDFELLAGECNPEPDCPKVLRIGPGLLVVVGAAVEGPSSGSAVPGHVSITAELYDAALERLPTAEVGAPLTSAVVRVSGEPITDPRLLAEYGVGRGEGAVRIDELDFRALAIAVIA